jgi:ribosomal protein L37AE/L43A
MEIDSEGRLHAGPRHESSRKPAKCPKCGSKRVARIQYGLPAFTEELERQLAEGKVVLGGCCMTDDDPAWQCADCGEQVWRKRQQNARQQESKESL